MKLFNGLVFNVYRLYTTVTRPKFCYGLYLSAILSLPACTSYLAQPINKPSLNPQTQTFNPEQLRIQAAELKHPLLKPVLFDLSNGLSPDEAAILAVLRNPSLRAARAKHGIANAQLLQAGLLPNPRLAYSFASPTGGLDAGKVTGYGLSLDWEVTALLTQSNKVSAAGAEQQAIDLQIAWQEWQIAQAAKLACYQWQVYIQQQTLLTESQQRLQHNSDALQQAAEAGLVTTLDSLAAVTAKTTLESRLQAVRQQQNTQQQRLNRALGLKPNESLPLQPASALPDVLSVPAYAQLIAHLAEQRLDLRALQQGYRAQEEQVRIAILQQFPKISIGLTQSKNNSDYYTMGAGIALSLPIFDQNQGVIALATATRQSLYDEYHNRDFQTKADIAELLVTITAINAEIKTAHSALENLHTLLSAYETAEAQGQIDRVAYYAAWNNVTDKQVELLTLQLHLQEARIALETATGRYAL